MERTTELENAASQPLLPEGYRIRPAEETDLPAVSELLRPFVEQRKVLRRTRAETTALLHTAFVAEFAGQVVGFSAVEIYSKKLSEIQCLTVRDAHQGRGIGGALVRHCVDLARRRGVMEVMAISSSEKFLHDLGFDYSLPDQKRALFFQLRSREEVYRELEELGE
ncbi:MAG: GNAT family N-acetyltransferase [Planctomycetales bacterium]|nr:GNAT family N-acetyltransferase [Planctomycetales bacterium]